MPDDKFLNSLGLARRAGKLSAGHDDVKYSLRNNKARVVVIAKDASARLAEEMENLAGKKTKVIESEYSSGDFEAATGRKAVVYSVNDKNLCELVMKNFEREE